MNSQYRHKNGNTVTVNKVVPCEVSGGRTVHYTHAGVPETLGYNQFKKKFSYLKGKRI